MYACIHGHMDVIDALLEDERIEVYGFEVRNPKNCFYFVKLIFIRDPHYIWHVFLEILKLLKEFFNIKK